MAQKTHADVQLYPEEGISLRRGCADEGFDVKGKKTKCIAKERQLKGHVLKSFALVAEAASTAPRRGTAAGTRDGQMTGTEMRETSAITAPQEIDQAVGKKKLRAVRTEDVGWNIRKTSSELRRSATEYKQKCS